MFTIKCEEVSVNFSRLFIHTIFTILISIPKSKSYIIVYRILSSLFNKHFTFSIYNYIFIITVGFLIYFIKFSILLIFGYSYLSIVTTSNLIVKFFVVTSYNCESTKSYYQHIILNCILNNSDTIGKAGELKITVDDEGQLIFNPGELLVSFLLIVKESHLLSKAFGRKCDNMFLKFLGNGHFTFLFVSTKHLDKNITVNLTSNHLFTIHNKNENKTEILELKHGFISNIKGENKPNYFTPPYSIDFKLSKIKEIPSNLTLNVNKCEVKAQVYLVFEKDTDILISEEGSNFKNNDSLTVEQFALEYNISIID